MGFAPKAGSFLNITAKKKLTSTFDQELTLLIGGARLDMVIMPVIATLCHILKGERLLLQKKSKGLFGAGKWNGVGGKLEQNETLEQCVKREVFEETGLKVLDLTHHGTLIYYFGDREEPSWIIYVFSAKSFEGKLKQSKEGILRWFRFNEIPYDEMWSDDRHWLPLLLKDRKFEGKFYFDEEGRGLLDFNLKVH